MPHVAFDELPDHGRMWIFPAGRALTPDERAALLREVDAFLDGWAAHGAPLRSGREMVGDHFLVVGVDEDVEAPSGCSIDALVNRLRALGDDLDVELIRHAPVWYRAADGVRVASRAAFRQLASEGTVGPDTPVFDTSLVRLGDYRKGLLERPARETWHGRAFFKEQVAGG